MEWVFAIAGLIGGVLTIIAYRNIHSELENIKQELVLINTKINIRLYTSKGN